MTKMGNLKLLISVIKPLDIFLQSKDVDTIRLFKDIMDEVREKSDVDTYIFSSFLQQLNMKLIELGLEDEFKEMLMSSKEEL